MLAFEATTTINAPIETVWRVLTQVDDWTNWEPNVTKVEGTVALGNTVTVHTSFSDRAFPVKVAELVENKKMVWASGMPLGLFKGARTFTLTPVDGGVMVKTREEFTGLLLPLFKGQIGDLQPTFDQFADALKAKAES